VRISIIAAYRRSDRAIGADGHLPWHLPADMAHFRRVTMGHTLILGHRTLNSLAGRSLPGRRIILLSRSATIQPPGVEAIAHDLEQALELAENSYLEDEVFIGGGGMVYRRALEQDLVDRMVLTVVDAPPDETADTYFPDIDSARWELVEEERRPADERNPFDITYQVLTRLRPSSDRSDSGPTPA
jgi:dihydrofolate reductase